MKVLLTAVTMAAIFLLAPASVAGQAASGPQYDPTTEVTVQGKVLSIHDRQCPVSGTIGAHFMLEAVDGKVYEVHLAPAKFTKMLDMIFTPGEKVEVIGNTLTFQDKDAILARQVKHGNETVTFRDKKGNPSWN